LKATNNNNKYLYIYLKINNKKLTLIEKREKPKDIYGAIQLPNVPPSQLSEPLCFKPRCVKTKRKRKRKCKNR